MPTITIEDVPPDLLLRLAAAAAASGRGLNSEIIAQLARSANAGVLGAARPGTPSASATAMCTGWGGPASGGTA